MQPMSPVIPGAEALEVIYAEKQPQYNALPCIRAVDGTILTRWNFTEEEKRQVLEQGYVYLSVSTFNQPLQPVLLSVTPPEGFATARLKSGPKRSRRDVSDRH